MNRTARPLSQASWLIAAVVVGLLAFLFIGLRVFGGDAPLEEVFSRMQATPDYGAMLFINALVGISIALFIVQLRGRALRVLFTVAIALIFGYLMTAFFNADTANQYLRGEFDVAVLSTAEPIEGDDLDLTYGDSRGGEFNQPGARTPLTEGRYTFQGRAGDVVTIAAYAANRRSTVDLELALLDAEGAALAAATSATPEQVETLDGLRSERDAVLADFSLPADGIYSVLVKPTPPTFDVIIGETLGATNAAYDAFLFGALGRPNRWAIWIQDAFTLILLVLSGAVVFRARQFSLGAEGQLYMGALIAAVISLNFGTLPPLVIIPLTIISAMLIGFLWGLIPGALKAYLGANELVSSLMLNTIAVRFFEMVLTFQLKPPEAGYISSAFYNENALLPPIIADTQITVAIFGIIAIVVAVWLLISRTPLGYEIRMVGANPRFADYGGINTRRTIMLAMAVSGVIAGLAGMHLSNGIFRQIVVGMASGLAFEGVVVALLARNNPLVIPFTALLYAYLRAGAQFMERDANISFEVVRIIQAIIILLITAEALLSFWQNRRVQRQAVAGPAGAVAAPAEEKARV